VAAGIEDLFAMRGDGEGSRRDRLRRKPAPDLLLAATGAFGVAPAHRAVVEDAIAGVEASHAGEFGFGWVVGIDRSGTAASVLSHGTTRIATDLAPRLEER
jgi:beta-phosphoglucomutase-like phosphatase (HAD superfamily)